MSDRLGPSPGSPLPAATPARALWFLEALLSEYPQYPAVALWRCWECALLTGLSLREPLLDLGCGDGRIAERVLAPGAAQDLPRTPYGLDIESESLAGAAHRGLYRGLTLADARAMPFAADTFRSVMSVCVLEHIADVGACLREVSRVLAPGGVFAFSVPTPQLEAVAAAMHPRDPQGYVQELRERVAHVNVWGSERWEEELASAGFGATELHGFMPSGAAREWFAAYDWTVRPMPGRGWVYRAAGPGLRRFGLRRALAGYWSGRLRRAAEEGVTADLNDACALLIVTRRL